ncbi:hypothetical protein [Lacicoccus qingdaonensis]|uniref:tRNA_anti-like n=1 Tax=Lacicoccus qingdaonensis TaxID=576118 RepID=A0A1G9CTW5_9BACL|nr:hypothetical protein [Salinicoccus qingdaonensis]SDK54885.1 hypothetical protein SAMN05216216_104176 [Salinicoccus qingdaonensis]
MDAILGILVLLMVLSLLVGTFGVIALIIMAISKKGLKTPGIITGSGFGIFVIATLVILIISIGNNDNTTSTANYPTSSSDAQSSDGTEEVDDTEYEITDEQREEFNEEYDEKMAEAREEREAEDGTDSEDLDNYRADVDIRDIERNPDDYMNELITFEGKIIQVLEEDGVSAYRIAVNDDYDRVVLVSTQSSSLEERLLEDDYVTVYGEFTELMTYETVVGGSRTVPSFVAAGERIELQ